MAFQRYQVRRDIVIHELCSFYYFELSKHYSFQGETHDFWELVYVDKGEIEFVTDSGVYQLAQGDMLMHEPNEFHSPRSNGKIAPNMFIISFECRSPAMQFFMQNKKFHLDDEERALLARLIQEGSAAFAVNLPSVANGGSLLVARDDAPFGSEAVAVLHLELLLTLLIRKGEVPRSTGSISTAAKEKREADLFEQITAYMRQNLDGKHTLDDLCSDFAIGRTHLGILFKKRLDCGAMEHWNKLKIDKAKEYIRENNFTLTEIAELLGYSSVHYFSRHFKKTTGTTPSEYAKTLQSRLYQARSDR